MCVVTSAGVVRSRVSRVYVYIYVPYYIGAVNYLSRELKNRAKWRSVGSLDRLIVHSREKE